MMDEEFTVEDKEHELDQVQKHAHDLYRAKTEPEKAGHRYALGMAKSAAGIRGATEQDIADAIAAGS